MRWSNILKKDDTNQTAEDVSVLDYTPKEFNFGTPGAAIDYLKQKEKGSDFLLSEVLRTTTGVEEIERLSEERAEDGRQRPFERGGHQGADLECGHAGRRGRSAWLARQGQDRQRRHRVPELPEAL